MFFYVAHQILKRSTFTFCGYMFFFYISTTAYVSQAVSLPMRRMWKNSARSIVSVFASDCGKIGWLGGKCWAMGKDVLGHDYPTHHTCPLRICENEFFNFIKMLAKPSSWKSYGCLLVLGKWLYDCYIFIIVKSGVDFHLLRWPEAAKDEWESRGHELWQDNMKVW